MGSAILNRVYEDFDPPTDLVSEEICDTILVYLPGYKKEQLRVQLTPSHLLKLSGERPIADNKWRRFQKEFRVPPNCDTKGISAKFEGGILYIRQPKVIPPVTTNTQHPQEKGKPALESSTPQPPQPEPQPEKERTPPKEEPAKEEAPQPKPQLKGEAPSGDQPKEGDRMRGNTKEDEERENTISEVINRSPRQVVYGSGLFRELRKPENMKRLVISTVLVLAIGFYASYVFKSFTGNEQRNGSGYEQSEL